MDKTLDPLFDFDKHAKIRDTGNETFNHVSHMVALQQSLPGVFLKPLQAQGELSLLGVDIENQSLNRRPLLEAIRRGPLPPRPGEFGHMNQPVDTILDTNEKTKVSEILNLALHDGAGQVLLSKLLPGIGQKLFHAQRYSLLLNINVEHLKLKSVTPRYHLTGVLQLLVPAHLTHMEKAFQAGFKLNKNAVVDDADRLTPYLAPN